MNMLRVALTLGSIAVIGAWLLGGETPEPAEQVAPPPPRPRPWTPSAAPTAAAPAPKAAPVLAAAVFEDEREVALGRPVYHPRDPEEWQGMRVDLSLTPLCEDSEHCGLARACLDGRCVACTTDSDCGGEEACVLEHCVQATRMGCRSRRDCPSGERCVLTGYGTGVRGNEGMASTCLAPRGGRAETE